MTSRATRTLLFGLAATVFFIGPAMAQEGVTETFDSAELPGWELGPNASVGDGTLSIAPGGFAFKGGNWQDFTLQVKVKWQGPGEILLQYHAREQSNHTLILLPNEVLLERSDGTGTEIVGAAGHEEFSSDSWTDLMVEVSGTEHTISLGGEQVLRVTDSVVLEPGPIGLTVQGESTAEFDDLTLSGSAALSAEGTGEPVPEDGESGEPPPFEGAPGAEPTSTETTATTLATDQGGISGWLDSFFLGQAQATEIATFGINLVLAALLSFVLGLVYIHWGTSLSNRRRFAANFMLITITTTFIILVVRSSVALSLGLVGALSIVRFRAAIKEPEELAYLFLAVGIGIGLGDNQRLITIMALAVAIAFIAVRRLFHSRESDVNMHLMVAGDNPEVVALTAVLATLRPHVQRLKLVRFDESRGAFEVSLLVEFRELVHLHDAHAALLALSPDLDITFLDNQGIG